MDLDFYTKSKNILKSIVVFICSMKKFELLENLAVDTGSVYSNVAMSSVKKELLVRACLTLGMSSLPNGFNTRSKNLYSIEAGSL